MTVYVDPVLLAVSDCLVLTALERAWARTVPRSERTRVAPRDRHRGYELVAIRLDRIDKALEGAWGSCRLLAHRHDLPVAADEWSTLLDSYARALIMMQQAHGPGQLATALAPIAHPTPDSRAFLEVG